MQQKIEAESNLRNPARNSTRNDHGEIGNRLSFTAWPHAALKKLACTHTPLAEQRSPARFVRYAPIL